VQRRGRELLGLRWQLERATDDRVQKRELAGVLVKELLERVSLGRGLYRVEMLEEQIRLVAQSAQVLIHAKLVLVGDPEREHTENAGRQGSDNQTSSCLRTCAQDLAPCRPRSARAKSPGRVSVLRVSPKTA